MVSFVVQVVADHTASQAEEEDHEVNADGSAEAFAILEVVSGDLDLVDDC